MLAWKRDQLQSHSTYSCQEPGKRGWIRTGLFSKCALASGLCRYGEDRKHPRLLRIWMPLVDATAETGCMEVMPHVFKLGYLNHQAEGGTMIVPEKLPQVEPVLAECPKGSLVIMNKYTPHRGISNRSNIIRWSIDLRYHKSGANSGRSFSTFISCSQQL